MPAPRSNSRFVNPTPHPDDTKAHLEMAYELAREVIEQARIAECAKERTKELDLERYQARSLRRGWGAPERSGRSACWGKSGAFLGTRPTS